MNRKLKFLAALSACGALVTGVAIAASSPSVSTGGTSSRGETSIVLHGTINPNGASTRYAFQFGLTNTYGATTATKTLAAGTKTVAVTTTASGLIPGTPYHYRLVASSGAGTTVGRDRTFTTAGSPPPNVATGPASQISTNGATVSGIINPEGSKTTYFFQYGLTNAYGSQTFTGTVPPGRNILAVTAALTGLQSGSWFHYRLVAVHSVGPASYGADQLFFTYPSPRPNPQLPLSIRPVRTNKRPFTFTTTGKLVPPSWIPRPQACFEGVYVRFFLGRKQLSFHNVQVQPNCTFTDKTVFRRLPGRGKPNRTVKLTVRYHFRGNPYVAPFDPRPRTVALVG